MKVLGINPAFGARSDLGLWAEHDGGACLIEDGEVKYAFEEERLIRQKRAYDTFPSESIESIFEAADTDLSEIDEIAVGRDPGLLWKDMRFKPSMYLPSGPTDYAVLKHLATVTAGFTSIPLDQVKSELRRLPGDEESCEYTKVSHHRSHMASARYMSGFEEQLVFTLDGRGEYDATVVWQEGERVRTYPRSQSLGKLYSLGAVYLGFRGGRDAGKFMGLAAYGQEREGFEEKLERVISITDEGYRINKDVFKNESGIRSQFEDLFGPRRSYGDDIDQRHKDFAFHLQKKLVQAVKSLISHHISKRDIHKVSLAGGVAMNCKMNREIEAMDEVEELFVQPASDDRGISLGAALETYNRKKEFSERIRDVYYGRSYSNEKMESLLQRNGLEYSREEQISQRAAELLAEGKTVGWFQGRMEFGARALGNRSILANPTDEKYRDRVNRHVKSREAWRPFAPSILHEERDRYLVEEEESPFMIRARSVTERAKEEIPAVVHVDDSCRPQTVRSEVNPRFHRLISKFRDITGVPAVLNTSFNKSGDPIIESPEQAIETFYSAGLDALALGDFLLMKE